MKKKGLKKKAQIKNKWKIILKKLEYLIMIFKKTFYAFLRILMTRKSIFTILLKLPEY